MTPQDRLQTLIRQHGWAATCTQALNPGLSVWLGGGSAVAYRRVVRGLGGAGVRVVAGEPIGPPDVAGRTRDAFETDARACGDAVVWFGVERVDALAGDRARLVVGAQPAWNPQSWDALVATTATIRAQRNRARNKRLVVTERSADDAAADPALRGLLAEWLATRGLPPLGFLADPLVLDTLGDRRVWTAEQAGRPVAYAILAPVPARAGWLVEWIVRGDDAPNGTPTLLVDAAMRAVAREGARYVTLGLVPLAAHAPRTPGGVPAHVRFALSWTRAHGRRFYNFEGLERFKARFRPDRWEPVWLVTTEPRVGLRTLYAVGGAFARDRGPVRLVAAALGGAVRREAEMARDRLSRRR